MKASCTRRTVALAIIGLTLAGCSTRAGWDYTPSPAKVSPTSVPVSLAVARFDDQRGTENSRYFWVCIIPLVPYCTASYDRPETANGFLTEAAYNFRPSDDLPQAAAQEIKQTGYFRDVFVTDRTADPGAPLLLRGTIQNSQWNGSEYTYLLGPYGSLPWIFGAPLGSAGNTLGVKLDLVEVSSGRILWTNNINQSYEITEGLYSNYAKDFGYAEMYRDGMVPAVASLQAWAASQPPDFWTHLQSEPKSASTPIAPSPGAATFKGE